MHWSPLIVALMFAGLSSVLFAADRGDVARGRRLFMADGCYACHGTVGQGATVTGPRLAPDPLPLETFMAIVRRPPNVMPPYSAKVLSDRDIVDIHAYLSSMPKPRSSAKVVP